MGYLFIRFSKIFSFWLILALITPSYIFSNEPLSQQLNKIQQIDQSMYTNEDIGIYQYVQTLMQDIIANYRNKKYKEALRASKTAQRAIDPLPNPSKEQLLAIFSSIDNIINIKDLEDKKTVNLKKQPQKIVWNADEISSLDQARYLFGLWINPNFEVFDINGRKNIYRAGLEANIEFFLPYLERSIGFSGSYSTGFLDFNEAKMVDTYMIHQYSAFFQYRLAWNLPAIDQTATLTIRAGAIGQFVTESVPNSFPIDQLKSYIMPAIELSVQDPLLNRIFQNSFNKNLIFNPTLSFHYLPGNNEAIGFATHLGIYYRFEQFLIGPRYTFQLYYGLDSNISQNFSRLSLVLSTQI